VLCTDDLSSVKLGLWIYAQEQENVRRLKETNKEEEEVGGHSPTLG
jgi:hypothetical protein